MNKCMNCKETDSSPSKSIDSRFIPGTILQELNVGVVRGSNNKKRKLVLTVANDNEYGFITKSFTRNDIESDLYSYIE